MFAVSQCVLVRREVSITIKTFVQCILEFSNADCQEMGSLFTMKEEEMAMCRVCVCVCVRACVRACVRVCVDGYNTSVINLGYCADES